METLGCSLSLPKFSQESILCDITMPRAHQPAEMLSKNELSVDLQPKPGEKHVAWETADSWVKYYALKNMLALFFAMAPDIQKLPGHMALGSQRG